MLLLLLALTEKINDSALCDRNKLTLLGGCRQQQLQLQVYVIFYRLQCRLPVVHIHPPPPSHPLLD